MASRESKPPPNVPARPKAVVDLAIADDVALVNVLGLVDEHFGGFGELGSGVKTVVINVAGMTRMTSFGVRQWLKGMDALPRSISDLYLLNCPTFFVDQLNMVLNFGGPGQVLTVLAPYTCPSCGVESSETIDVLVDRSTLAKGGVSEKDCARCGGRLEFDETPESYFSFVTKYAASSIQPAAARVLAAQGLYTAVDVVSSEKPPKIIKLVHGSVTYFRIIGTIGSMFRARPFLVGAEGEVVIDLAEMERFDALGYREWRRLLKSLTGQVPNVTLVDVGDSLMTLASDSFALARNISVWSVIARYVCNDCGRTSSESVQIDNWPVQFPNHVCTTCGGVTRNQLRSEVLAPLQKASTATPPASAKLITQREEILSRARTDAAVAQAGDAATAAMATDDTILGKYKIVKRLSAGGMAEVFLAKQVGIGGFEKPVALKRIQRQLLETRHLAIDMFLNEAKIAGRLIHPNIVQVLDVGEVGGALYLAMEYVHGRDLRDIIKRLRASRALMPLGDACFVICEVAKALHHAYSSTDLGGQRLAVVHRDVSPHNVILSYDGTVKLLDFGVAMSSVTEQAETMMIVGKWMYMSPEHTTNQQLDHRSDLFSLGVIMYLLITGAMPFVGNDPKEIVKKIRGGQFKRVHELAPDLPRGLAELVERLLSPRPQDRPQTGQEVVSTLTEITRSYGIESSAGNIANLLSGLFADELAGQEAPVVHEIVRVNARPTDELEMLTRKVAIGSGLTQAQNPDDKSPVGPRNTPSSWVAASETSVSIPPRKTQDSVPIPVTVPVQVIQPGYKSELMMPMAPRQESSGAMALRIIVSVVIVAVLVVVAYLFVRPR